MKLLDRETTSYFNAFTGRMGHRQIASHIQSLPEWWKLRDQYGQTPLMCALRAKGMHIDIFTDLIEHPEVSATLTHQDDRGHNIWKHLFYYRGYRKDTHDWVHVLAPHAPLQPSNLPRLGIFPEIIVSRKESSWCHFFPVNYFGRRIYDHPQSRYDSLWHCPDEHALQVTHWLLAVIKPHKDSMYSIVDSLNACERHQPGGMSTLPPALQGALRLFRLLREPYRSDEWQSLASSGIVQMMPKTRHLYEKRLLQTPAPYRKPALDFLRDYDAITLSKHTVAANAQAVSRRL